MAESDARYRNPDDDPRGPYVLVDITSPFLRPILTYEWRGHRPPEGRCWRYTAERLEELHDQGAIFFRTSGLPRLKRYLADIKAASGEDVQSLSRIEIIVREAMRGLATEIARNPAALDEIEWRDLERILREVFIQLGFRTQLTRPGKDGGFDLILTCIEKGQPMAFLVEVKHWIAHSKKPGAPAASALFDIVASSADISSGLLLSSSGFTRSILRGRSEIEQQRIRLGGREKIVSLCQSYVEERTGLWKPAVGLPELLFDGTL